MSSSDKMDVTDTDFTPLDMSNEISPIAQNEDSVKDLTENIVLEPDSTTQAILDDADESTEPMDTVVTEESVEDPNESTEPMDLAKPEEPMETSESPVSSEEDGLECLEKIRALLSTGKSHKAKIDQIKDILNATSGGRKTKRRARNSKKRRNSKKGGKHSKKRRHGKTHRK